MSDINRIKAEWLQIIEDAFNLAGSYKAADYIRWQIEAIERPVDPSPPKTEASVELYSRRLLEVGGWVYERNTAAERLIDNVIRAKEELLAAGFNMIVSCINDLDRTTGGT